MVKLVFFYGTLKRGQYNYERFKQGLTFVCEDSVRGMALVQEDRCPYPHAILDGLSEITGEVFECTPECFRMIDGMEKGAGYKSMLVETVSGKVVTMYYSDWTGHQELSRFTTFPRGS